MEQTKPIKDIKENRPAATGSAHKRKKVDVMEDMIKRLTEKSIEAFILGLEIYNKPTIKYRIEGFSFFIVNAWELMLKATLLKRGISIYFPDKPDRTLSVENVVKKIYTDEKHSYQTELGKNY